VPQHRDEKLIGVVKLGKFNLPLNVGDLGFKLTAC
jgi:hypothetical protein